MSQRIDERLKRFLSLPREKKRRIFARYWQMLAARIGKGDLGKPCDWRSEQRKIHKFNRKG